MEGKDEVKRLSATIAILAVVVLAAIDVVLLLVGGVEATFSRVIFEASGKHRMIPLAAGILIGHWFWPQPSDAKLRAAAKNVLDWYDRDGSVGGADVVMEELRDALEGK